MNNPCGNAAVAAGRLALRLDVACNFAAVRDGALAVRAWLEANGVGSDDLNGWELALVEAGNNAVEHATPQALSRPITLDLSLGPDDLEARVTDHTPGFDLPDAPELPDLESEGGRGLFLIRALTDHAAYLRGKDENQLILRKRCARTTPASRADIAEIQRLLAESEQAVEQMGEELSSSYESLVAIFRYSAELGQDTDLREFSRRLVADLRQLTESDLAVLRLVNGARLETFMVSAADGHACTGLDRPVEGGSGVEAEALRSREDIWIGAGNPLAEQDPLSPVNPRSGIVHAFGSGGLQLGTITLLRCKSDVPLRSAQLNILHTLSDFLGIQIVNARLLNERTESRITRRELEIAANIQRSLLPVSVPEVPPFEVAASCTSAREVGGDFYDILRVGEAGVLLVIADVMGKGVPAALFAAVLRSATRSMPLLFTEPAALLTAVNRTLGEDLARVDMFVTAKVVFLDFQRCRLVSASAGHCPLLIWKPGDAIAEIADDSGLPLGILPDATYAQTEAEFPPGAVALLYTDGITESHAPDGEMYGLDRLMAFLPALASLETPAAGLDGILLRELEAYRSGSALADDQTFLVLRHRP